MHFPDRYKPLPDPVAKVQFLGLQLELLEDFRIRLVQVMKEAAHIPTGHAYTAVLNAIHYIVQVLREWNELVVGTVLMMDVFFSWHLFVLSCHCEHLPPEFVHRSTPSQHCCRT